MKFDAFDKAEQEKYTAEVKGKWGNTIAYQEYQQHEKGGSTGTPADLMRHFAKLGKLKHLAPTAPEAQAAIRDLQQFITDHFYTCTPEILAGLGQMYVADDCFRKNIDPLGWVSRTMTSVLASTAQEARNLRKNGLYPLCAMALPIVTVLIRNT